MGFDFELFDKLYSVNSPSGFEDSMVDQLKSILNNMNIFSESDNMKNTVARKCIDGNKKRLAIVVPIDANSFTLRYIDSSGKAYFYSEIETIDNNEDIHIQFDSENVVFIENFESKKIISNLNNCNGCLKAGSTGQLEKKYYIDFQNKIITGVELSGSINAYVMIKLIDQLQNNSNWDYYFVFSSQNRTDSYNQGGMTLSLNRIQPDFVIWLDTINYNKKKSIIFEVGDRNYFLEKKIKDCMKKLAKLKDIRIEEGIQIFNGKVADIIQTTGSRSLGVAIPSEGNLLKQSVIIDDIDAIITFLNELLITINDTF